ncbi:dienelactone hydrolase family protein [Dankookia sp. GCM10030260]|uniref:dienelactone hydrolase family protein n=1 Tax=Dankookia sp. GCM10030260 TaxID=3273390 RepID=UPI00360811BC
MPPPRLALVALLALALPAAAGDLPLLPEQPPPVPLQPAWAAAGRPVVVILPDHLGRDARVGFHAEALLAQGLAVLAIDLPAAEGIELGDRLRPRPPDPAEAAPALLPGLLALLRQLSTGEGQPRPVGVLGFGTGGEAALLAAQADRAGPRFAAHAALYPTCASAALRRDRLAGAPTSGAPLLLIIPHGGGAGDMPGGCARLYLPSGAPGRDPVTLHGYDSLGYGFDLWPAVAWATGDAGFDPLRFDALRARLARREIAAFFAAALAAPR